MNAGKLHHRGTIWRPVDGDEAEARGDPQPTWVQFATVWCSIEPLQGREMQFAQQVHGQVTHKVTLRYLPGVTPRMQLRWGGRVFNFGPVLSPDERRFLLTTYAAEKV